MKWVTRKHVHVDRVACPWLIKRFIDPDAVFKFILWPGTKLSPKDGTPFDFPKMDIPFTHHDGKCTFEVLIDHHKLQDPVLEEMARTSFALGNRYFALGFFLMLVSQCKFSPVLGLN